MTRPRLLTTWSLFRPLVVPASPPVTVAASPPMRLPSAPEAGSSFLDKTGREPRDDDASEDSLSRACAGAWSSWLSLLVILIWLSLRSLKRTGGVTFFGLVPSVLATGSSFGLVRCRDWSVLATGGSCGLVPVLNWSVSGNAFQQCFGRIS